MKRFIPLLLAAAAAISMTACGDSENTSQSETAQISEEMTAETAAEPESSAEAPSAENNKILVAYFSYAENADLSENADASSSASINLWNGKTTGNTGVVADMIANKTGGELHSIQTAEKYPNNYNETVNQGKAEAEADLRPELSSHIDNLDNYDTVFVGFPNWWYDMPMAMYSYFDEYDLSGKTVIPFCTSGGSGFSGTINTIKELEPNAEVVENGLSVGASSAAKAENDVSQWLKEIGY